MEMNTRLQVEHPVTEMITGTDLVEWQFKVAAGEPLPLAQDDIGIDGHAVEARLYAEDPARGFLPTPGVVSYFEAPWGTDLRADSGIDGGGAVVPPDYDPMIAKLIQHGDNRETAIAALANALRETRVVGVATNAAFLSRMLDHPEFRAGAVDTGFIERNLDALLPRPGPAPDPVLALACLALLLQRRELALQAVLESADPWSPWARADGWRLNDTGHTVLRFIEDGREIDIACHFVGEGYRLDLPGGAVRAAVHTPWPDIIGDGQLLIGGEVRVELDGARLAPTVVHDGDKLHIFHEGGHWRLGIHDPLTAAEAHEGASGGLTAPMPGKVAALHVKVGAAVTAGQPLIVVEAMKMEHTIHSPAAGQVAEVRFRPGDQVAGGEVVIVVEEAVL
jgi:3-methylcrotonyl-CoA carboxylase alpha subunit